MLMTVISCVKAKIKSLCSLARITQILFLSLAIALEKEAIDKAMLKMKDGLLRQLVHPTILRNV